MHQNAPETIVLPGFAQTRWGSLQRSLIPPDYRFKEWGPREGKGIEKERLKLGT